MQYWFQALGAALSLLVSAAGPEASPGWTVSARVEIPSLESGVEGKIVLRQEGLTLGEAGSILQIEAPECVDLLGEIPQGKLTGEMVVLGALRFPFGRPVDVGETEVPFRLKRPPREGEVLHLNVISYGHEDPVRARDGRQRRLHRKRLRLPLRPDARATEVPNDVSDWSAPTLQIGDRARFELPRPDGTLLSMEKDFLGKKNVVIVTYRGSG